MLSSIIHQIKNPALLQRERRYRLRVNADNNWLSRRPVPEVAEAREVS